MHIPAGNLQRLFVKWFSFLLQIATDLSQIDAILRQVSLLRRSNRSYVSSNKGILNDFANFARKNFCQSLLSKHLHASNVQFIENEAIARVFPCELGEIFKESFFKELIPLSDCFYFFAPQKFEILEGIFNENR